MSYVTRIGSPIDGIGDDDEFQIVHSQEPLGIVFLDGIALWAFQDLKHLLW
jgi:hypothetical protein